MSKTFSYDDECARLAEHFLKDKAATVPMDTCSLAQAIQDAVEDWFSSREDPPESGEAWAGGFADNH